MFIAIDKKDFVILFRSKVQKGRGGEQEKRDTNRWSKKDWREKKRGETKRRKERRKGRRREKQCTTRFNITLQFK